VLICAAGIALPFTPAGAALGFTPPPPAYWPVLLALIVGYAVLAQLAKRWFVRRWGVE
jgi:Mg2+-importing ATPase